MHVGMVGLGRMGANMAQRLIRGRHRVAGFDFSVQALGAAAALGVEPAKSLADLVSMLPTPRVVWLMIPAGTAVDTTLDALLSLLSPQDTVVDGGNSYYRDSQRRAAITAEKNIAFVDVGTSGGIWGLENGYSLMVGGDAAVVNRLNPLFESLAPTPTTGWGHVGPSGAGHFTKMIHNGIEYGMMQAYAEGFALMQRKEELQLDLHQVANIWREGSVVRSWLLDLTAQLLETDARLDSIAPFVADSGEGRWTVAEAIDLDVSAPVITLSLLQRLRSRDSASYADRLLAGMRAKFGGHALKSNPDK